MSFPRGQTRQATGGASGGGRGGRRRRPDDGRRRHVRTRPVARVHAGPEGAPRQDGPAIVAFFRPYRLQVAVVLVAIIATSLLGLVNPLLLKLLIDDAIPSRTSPS